MTPTLLITGGSSYLGRHLVRLAAATYPGDFCYTTFSADPLGLPQGVALDVRDGAAVDRLVASVAPDVIIHTVGSNRSADMTAVIVEGTRHITRAAAAVNARLLHISTDSVFGGAAAPYDESAPAAPVNEYGRAKAAAERLVVAHPNHVILRTSLIYGLTEMDQGTAWMVSALAAGQPVTLFTNQLRNPVWTGTLCRVCLELIDHPFRGIMNVAGRQVMSRAEFGQRMLDWWGITRRETLTLAPDDGRRWPLDCRLDLGLAERLLRTPMWGVDKVIRDQADDRPDSRKALA